jgi:hypothetical protein
LLVQRIGITGMTVSNGSQGKKCPELAKLLQRLSINLVPLHPDTQDDTLRSYFAGRCARL